jgi:hypothetical protein
VPSTGSLLGTKTLDEEYEFLACDARAAPDMNGRQAPVIE